MMGDSELGVEFDSKSCIELIDNASQRPRREGSIWCLISTTWYNAINNYVANNGNIKRKVDDIAGSQDETSADESKLPESNAPITEENKSNEVKSMEVNSNQNDLSNFSIVEIDSAGKYQLRPGLVENSDFIVVPEDAYGIIERNCRSQGPRIARNIVKISSSNDSLILDVYPLLVDVYVSKDALKGIIYHEEFVVSRYWSHSQLKSHLAPNCTADINNVRLWVMTRPLVLSNVCEAGCSTLSCPQLPTRTSPVKLTVDIADIDDEGWRLLGRNRAASSGDSGEFEILVSELAVDYEFERRMKVLVEIGIKATMDGRICWPREQHRLFWRSQFMIGDRIDVRDSENKWYESEIINIDRGSLVSQAKVHGIQPIKLLVHFRGWGAKYDIWLSSMEPILQPLFSQSNRWRHELAEGSLLDVCFVSGSVRQWYPGLVCNLGFGDKSGSVLVKAKSATNDRAHEIWLDVDCEEIMPLHTHTKKDRSIHAIQELTLGKYVWATSTTSQLLGNSVYSAYGDNGNIQSITAFCNDNSSYLSTSSINNFSSNARLGWISAVGERSRKTEAGAVGLKNLGNTCFMNSVIQCINGIEAIVDVFLSGRFATDINSDNILGTGGQVANAMHHLLRQLWSGKYTSVEPREIKHAISKRIVQFAGLNQQDANEILIALLDLIHEDLNRATSAHRIYANELTIDESQPMHVVAAQQWTRHCLRNNSMIGNEIFGQFCTRTTCTNCRSVSHSFDPFNCLQLPIPFAGRFSSISLEDCIREYCHEQQLPVGDLYRCEKCLQCRPPLIKIDILRWPRTLIVQLKRFYVEMDGKMQRRMKLDRFVSFPMEELDISVWNCGNCDPTRPVATDAVQVKDGLDLPLSDVGADTEQSIYDLSAVCCHTGNLSGGHYYSYVKHCKTSIWREFNDSQVRICDATDIVSPDAYLLFYQRRSKSSERPGT